MDKKQAVATLMEEDSSVGEAYRARVTPHLFIIHAQGVVVYAGAIDSIPSDRVTDIKRATNPLRQGLTELMPRKRACLRWARNGLRMG